MSNPAESVDTWIYHQLINQCGRSSKADGKTISYRDKNLHNL